MRFVTIVLSLSLLFACKQKEECRVEVKPGKFAVDVPFIDSVEIDGDLSDWDSNGVQVNLYSGVYGELVEENDCKSYFKLGWNKEGLLLFVDVIDDKMYIDKNMKYLGDGLEVFMIDTFGGKNMIQFFLAPLEDSAEFILRSFSDLRKGMSTKPPVVLNGKVVLKENGYNMEVLLPFSNLNIKPEKGTNLAFQLYVNDFDEKRDKEMHKLTWYHIEETYKNTYAAQEIKLIDTIVPQLTHNVKAWLIDKVYLEARVFFNPDSTNKNLVVKNNNMVLYDSVFVKDSVFSNTYDFSFPVEELSGNIVEFYVNDQQIRNIDISNLIIKYVNLPKPPRFESTIIDYERKDKQNFPPEGGTLVIGSSSIVMWKSIKKDLEGLDIIHRGFGGSTAAEALYYIDRIVLPYKPSKILYYEGDNDIGSGITPEDFNATTRKFVKKVHEALPKTTIYILSIKPSVKRIHIWDIADRANKLSAELANELDYVEFIDVAAGMFDENGIIRKDIFIHDSLHMNPKGYKIWTKIVRESLIVKQD